MKISKIEVRIGGTINTGNYSNLKVELMSEAILEDGDDPEVVRDLLIADQRAELQRVAADVLTRKIATTQKQDKWFEQVPDWLVSKLGDIASLQVTAEVSGSEDRYAQGYKDAMKDVVMPVDKPSDDTPAEQTTMSFEEAVKFENKHKSHYKRG